MYRGRLGVSLCLAALLAGCGGGGGGSGGGSQFTSGSGGGTATPAPTPAAGTGCTLRERQDWAAAQLRENYLFPETLPASLDPAPFATVSDYVDALTATARAQRRDRFFTYVTSIAEENAFFASGSSAGFGVRLALDSVNRRLLISEAFEGAPALAAGIDRGTEILAVGTSPDTMRTVDAILAAEGAAGLTAALGPSTSGTFRLLRIRDAAGTREVPVAKADFEIQPVSNRYGVRILDDGGRRVGYINLRTFISTANPALRQAFAQLRGAGITSIIVDLRYNGGGLVSTAELMNDLLGGNRSTGDVQGYTTFRPEKSASNTTRLFQPQPESVAPVRLAFIGTGGTASASEIVINTMTPYLRSASALIGSNTFGKPVGQIGVDRAACDDRLRITAFAVQNSARSAAYFDGLAATVEASCQAADDLAFPLGDPREASTARALDFLAGRPCTPISVSPTAAAPTASARSATVEGGRLSAAPRDLLLPNRPAPAQREVPGLF